MLFEDYAKGCFSISGDLVQKAREWDLRNKTRKGGYLSASQIQHILVNPFYYGMMRTKSSDPGCGAGTADVVERAGAQNGYWHARSLDYLGGALPRLLE